MLYVNPVKVTGFILIALLGSLPAAGGSLPEQMPADFSIYLTQGGGMRPEGEHIYFSAEFGYFEKYAHRKTSKLFFPVGTDALRELYHMLKKNKFQAIGQKREKIHDRGGISVQVTAGKKTISKSDAGMTMIPEAARAQWRNIVEQIVMAKERLITSGQAVTLALSDQYGQHQHDITLFVGLRSVYHHRYGADGPVDTRGDAEFFFLPGNYPLRIVVHGPQIPQYDKSLNLKIPPAAKRVQLLILPSAVSAEVDL